MASEQQIKAFIAEMAPCAQEAYKTIGKVLPSVCIGMACVESAYGTSQIMRNHNAFFGQKVGSGKTAKKYWGGKFFTSKTKEEYTVGTHTVITDAFRAYDSMLQCTLNYYELLNTGLYSRVTSGVDYATQMAQIKQCGYMTSSTEVNSVISLIKKYDLTQYDRWTAASIPEPVNGNPYQEPTKNVRLNSKGNDVRWLQFELNRRGYKLIVDGIAWNMTIGAVMDFQKKAGLVPDGICGPLTRAALKS